MSIVRGIPILALLLTSASAAPAQTAPTAAERVLAAASIPALAIDARAAGVSDRELRGQLDLMRDTKLPATDARVILIEEARVARKDGPKPEFARFVRQQLAAGVRGEALAGAIRAGPAARGKKAPRREELP